MTTTTDTSPLRMLAMRAREMADRHVDNPARAHYYDGVQDVLLWLAGSNQFEIEKMLEETR